MGKRDFGNPPQLSTQAAGANATTNTMIAQVPTTGVTALVDAIYEVRFIVGCSTNVLWKLEHALSSGITDTSTRDVTIVYTGTNQSAEFVQTYKAESGDRFRVRHVSSVTASYAGHIQIEKLT